MKIRYAKTEDLKAIQDLNHELFLEDNKYHNDMNTNWPYDAVGEKYFISCIKDDNRLSIVAEVEGKVVGYLNAIIKKPNSAYPGKHVELDNMCVTKTYRSQGIGSELIKRFKLWAIDCNADKIVALTIFQNERAIKFYKQNGFGEYELKLIQDV